MPRNKPILFPKSSRILVEFGENIRLARLRRNFSAAQVAERANISRPTLTALETGAPGVSIGHIVQVLGVLGLEKDMLEVGKDDVLGRKLMDLGLEVRKRAPKRKNINLKDC